MILGFTAIFAIVAEMFLYESKIFERVFIMKKCSVAAIFLFCLIFNVSASAETLYSGNVSDIIQIMKSAGNEFGFNVWGTEYYTYKGVKRCELHFGHSQNNLIRFRLNNNNSIARMLVSVPNSYNTEAEMEDMMYAGLLAGICCITAGVDKDEYKQMWGTIVRDALDDLFATHFHKRYSVWCSKAQQYIIADVETDTSKIDYYFYPE